MTKSSSRLFICERRNVVAGFVVERHVVTRSAPILRKHIIGLATSVAVELLGHLGYTVEEIMIGD